MSQPEAPLPIPAGAKVILPVEKLTPAVKKERTEKQKEAYKRMRAGLDEAREKRQFSRKEALEKVDEMKEEERLKEEQERQRQAEELKAQGVDVVVQKRRGRKPGERIPYGGKVQAQEAPAQASESQEDILRRVISEAVSKGMMGQAPPTPHYPHNPATPHLNIPTASCALGEAYNAEHKNPVKPAVPEVKENPYLAMIRRRLR